MAWWDKKADDLVYKVRSAENLDETFDDDVKKAIVRTREDVVLLVSFLSSANRQLSSIKWALFFVVILLAFIAFRH